MREDWWPITRSRDPTQIEWEPKGVVRAKKKKEVRWRYGRSPKAHLAVNKVAAFSTIIYYYNKSMKIKLLPPLKNIDITQPFGENYVDFYKSMGLIGHNGIDYWARIGTNLFAAHSGVVVTAGTDGDGGKCIEILSNKTGDGYKTIYYHLNSIYVNVGDKVTTGQLIGQTGNTGKYTTGPHLHFGLKITKNGVTQNKDNGFRGAVNPGPYLPDGYDKSRSYKCYERKRNLQVEFWFRFAPAKIKNRWTEAGRYVHRAHKRLFYSIPIDTEMTNALLYGGWDLETVADPAMAQIWRWHKKDEWNRIKANL